MGRAKLNMELIKKEKARKVTYRKRKEGLLRKMHEFTTLCDVKACLIIYDSKNDAEPEEVWPKNDPPEVSRLVNLYKSKGKDGGCSRSYGLVDFFDDRTKKMEEELEKLRKINVENKFPTWFDFMSNLSEVQLRDFADSLNNKIEFVKNRIYLIRGDYHQKKNFVELGQEFMTQPKSQIYSQQQLPGLIQRGIELELTNQQLNPMDTVTATTVAAAAAAELRTMHYPQEHHMQSINRSSMMMLLMNAGIRDDAYQFGGGGSGGSSSCNVENASLKSQVYYESATGVVESMVYGSSMPLTRFYAPTLQPMPSPYVQMQHPVVPSVISPQLLPSPENLGADEIHHPRMMEPRAWY